MRNLGEQYLIVVVVFESRELASKIGTLSWNMQDSGSIPNNIKQQQEPATKILHLVS